MTPPDAVSGAATPAQQSSVCSHCKRPIRRCRGSKSFPDWWYHTDTGVKACTDQNHEAEPVATPEAQIPECVHAPEMPELSRFVDAERDRFSHLETAVRLYHALHELGTAESQLAALRVERDRAQEEAGVMDNALKYAIDYLSGGRRLTEDPLSEIKKRLLARPIPAEPKREEK